MIQRYQQLNFWFAEYDLDLYSVVDRLIQRMCQEDRVASLAVLQKNCVEGKAWSWITGYVQHLLWQNGLVGNESEITHKRVLSDEELSAVRSLLAKRLDHDEIKDSLLNTSNLLSYIFAWRDIDGGPHNIAVWVKKVSQSDEGLLQLLMRLRGRGVSSAKGKYLSLNLTQLGEFLGDKEVIEQRLARIEAGGQYPEVITEIRASQAHARF